MFGGGIDGEVVSSTNHSSFNYEIQMSGSTAESAGELNFDLLPKLAEIDEINDAKVANDDDLFDFNP